MSLQMTDREIEESINNCEVPIGYHQQEHYHEWIIRKLREERNGTNTKTTGTNDSDKQERY